MNIKDTFIPGLKVIEPKLFKDDRGFFMETFRKDLLEKKVGKAIEFVQENHSKSAANTLRGLHYQSEKTQGKYVRVVTGKIFDVVLDVRKSSLTIGKWFGIELSAENKSGLWVPPGLAHGFLALSDGAEIVYKCTDYYSPENEHIILWNDVDVGINWPIKDERELLMSGKDKLGKPFKDAVYL